MDSDNECGETFIFYTACEILLQGLEIFFTKERSNSVQASTATKVGAPGGSYAHPYTIFFLEHLLFTTQHLIMHQGAHCHVFLRWYIDC
jgi:hypothetical protein